MWKWEPAGGGKSLSAPLPRPLRIHPLRCVADAAEEKQHLFHHAQLHTEEKKKKNLLSVPFGSASTPSAKKPPRVPQVLMNCHDPPHFSLLPPQTHAR